MDIVTYALAKKMASSVASGITEVQTDGTNIRFKTAEGEWFTVRLNSVEDATVSGTGHLIIKLTDGTTIDAGVLPVGTMDTALSATSENGVQNKVITAALNGKQNVLTAGTGVAIDTTDPANPTISANVDYTNLVNKPTKLSDFTNDEGFIDNTVNNLTNYYLKTQTYTQAEVNDLISHLASLTVEIVETLPTQDISTTTIYLVNVPGTTNYAQWMYINNTWSNIGNTSVDLTNYYTKTQTDTLLADKVDKVAGKGLSTNDFTNAYKDMLDNYTVDSVLDSTSTNPIQNGTVTDALTLKQPKTLSAPIVVGGVSSTTVEGALGNLNALVDTKLPMVTSLPASPSNGEAVLYIGTATGGLKTGGIYQYQVSEWVLISNVSSFTFNSDEFAVDSTTNEVSLKPSYADIPSFLPSDASASNKLVTESNTKSTTLTSTDSLASWAGNAKGVMTAFIGTSSKPSDIGAPLSSWGETMIWCIGHEIRKTLFAIDYSVAQQVIYTREYFNGSFISNWSAIKDGNLTSSVTSGSTDPVTSGGVYDALKNTFGLIWVDEHTCTLDLSLLPYSNNGLCLITLLGNSNLEGSAVCSISRYENEWKISNVNTLVDAGSVGTITASISGTTLTISNTGACYGGSLSVRVGHLF